MTKGYSVVAYWPDGEFRDPAAVRSLPDLLTVAEWLTRQNEAGAYRFEVTDLWIANTARYPGDPDKK